jgi:hypothetical protein
MDYRVLPTVEDRMRQYKGEHHGEAPLYILMTNDEADNLMAELKSAKGYDADTLVTEFNGAKIIRNAALKPGDIRLTNELPETSS